ncbi:MAG TPA: HYR domain-containing protein [Chitinophagaceae bacterium]|nr:HYR domain-containing protein [Chitinophagaceae bacterium]
MLLIKVRVEAQTAPLDINARAYIHAAGITSSTEKNSVNKFVRALKYYGIWDNIHALYIPTGGTEQSQKLNLKDPRNSDSAFRLFYPHGADHSINGTAWNGINQGALTFYSPTSTRLHLMVYQDEDATESYMFSGDNNGITDFDSYTWSALYSNGYIGFANQGYYSEEEDADSKGFFYGQRFNNDSTEGFVNGVLTSKWLQPFSPYYNTDTSQKIWINKNNGDSAFLGTARYQVLSIGNVMNDSLVKKYYDIIQAFLTQLGIQYGDPAPWPYVPDNFVSEYTYGYNWVKASGDAVDTALDGVHLYSINDSLYLWGGWNGNYYPYSVNSGYVSGDGGHIWNKIGDAPWNIRHSAGYGTDNIGNGYLVGSDFMPESTDTNRLEVWKTTDGRNWNLQTNTAPWNSKLILHGLAIKGDTLYVGGGQFGTSVNSGVNDTIWESTDHGISWSAINTNAPQLGGILYNNFKYFSARKKFVAFCGGIYDYDPAQRIYSNQIWTSDDCINWVRENDVPFASREYSDMVEWDNKLWVWGGDRSSSSGSGFLNLKDLWYMDKDGQWHEVGSVPVPERHATGLAVDKKNDHLVFACGNLRKGAWYLEKSPIPPLFGYSNQDIFLQNNCSFIVPNFIDSLTKDFNGQVSFSQLPAPGSIISSLPGQTQQINITGNFGGGYTQSNTFLLNVKDTTKPSFTCPADTTAYLGNNCSFTVPNLITNLNVSDNCSTVIIRQVPAADSIISSFVGQTLPVIITADDNQGNVSSCTVTVTIKDTTAPVFNPVEAITQKCDSGKCNASVNINPPNASDNCSAVVVTGIRSDSLSLNAPFPVGNTVIIWKAKDGSGNTRILYQNIQVQDKESPIINYPGIIAIDSSFDNLYSLPLLDATDNCGISTIVYSITGATTRSGSGTDASGLLNTGNNTLTWTVTDIHGNSTSFQTLIDVSIPLEVTIPSVFSLPQGVSPNTLYIGYGPNFLTLPANVRGGSGPYSYEWSSGETSASIQVNKPVGLYDYSVTVTDSRGRQGTATTTINVMDIRCGSDYNKVSVCKLENGQLNTVCVNPTEVPALLATGQSYLGICPNNISNILSITSAGQVKNNLQVAVMPNPAAQFFTIKIQSLVNLPVVLSVFNALGIKMDERDNLPPGSVVQLGKEYFSGIYFLEVVQGNEKLTYKLIKNFE